VNAESKRPAVCSTIQPCVSLAIVPPLQSSKRLGPQYSREAIAQGSEALEGLLPGFQINMELLKASDWVSGVLHGPGA
jgi:hypothetical protein